MELHSGVRGLRAVKDYLRLRATFSRLKRTLILNSALTIPKAMVLIGSFQSLELLGLGSNRRGLHGGGGLTVSLLQGLVESLSDGISSK